MYQKQALEVLGIQHCCRRCCSRRKLPLLWQQGQTPTAAGAVAAGAVAAGAVAAGAVAAGAVVANPLWRHPGSSGISSSPFRY